MSALVPVLLVALLIGAGYGAGWWQSRRRERGLTTALGQRNDELQALREELARRSSLDGLTELATHQVAQQTLEREWRRSIRELTSLSVMLIDLDHFKAYNERLGPAAGDECLKAVARILREVVNRPSDLTARYAGDEFLVVLGRTDAEGALAVAAKLRTAVEALALPHPDSATSDRVTISLGVAAVFPSSHATWQEIELLAAAQRALAEAKQLGRNRVARAELA